MKKIVIRAGFHPDVVREYKGEHIYPITDIRGGVKGDIPTGDYQNDAGVFYRVHNGAWIKSLGGDKYVTDWAAVERWGRVEEVCDDGSVNVLGFMILRVDRSKAIL